MSSADVPTAADVVVIGGGIMGTATAYFLGTTTSKDVVLLEKDNIASGSTGDSSAILRHHYDDREIYTRMARWGHEFYRRFDEHLGESIAYDTAPMVRFADDSTEEAVLAGYEILRDLDIPVSKYEKDELEAQYPMIETGSFHLAVSDDDAGYSDGFDAASGFARAATAAGVSVCTGVGANALATEDDTISAVETDAGSIETDSVVVAAGPWTPRLLADVGVDVPITVTREQVLILDPPAEFVDEHLDDTPTSGAEDGWYLRPDFGEGVLLATHHSDDVVDPDAYSKNPDQSTMLELLDGVEEFMPALADADIKGEYCGLYSTTPDNGFILDEVGPSGCFVACGFSGHGFKHGPTVGRIMADLVTKGDTDLVDIDKLGFDRFE